MTWSFKVNLEIVWKTIHNDLPPLQIRAWYATAAEAPKKDL
jgi:uncharacterized protein with HEPN domain